MYPGLGVFGVVSLNLGAASPHCHRGTDTGPCGSGTRAGRFTVLVSLMTLPCSSYSLTISTCSTVSRLLYMAPRVGIEPTTVELTARCTAAVLPRNGRGHRNRTDVAARSELVPRTNTRPPLSLPTAVVFPTTVWALPPRCVGVVPLPAVLAIHEL